MFGREVSGLLGLFALLVVAFGLTSPQFLSAANFDSIAFQLPELGLLTLAMLAPIMSGGINLAIIATANLSGLTLAWILNMNGGPQAGVFAFVVGVGAALAVGGASGAAMGATIAYFGAHPILASLAMMIFLQRFGRISHARRRYFRLSGFPGRTRPRRDPRRSRDDARVHCGGNPLARAARAHASRLRGGDDRLQPAGERIFGNSRQALAHAGLRPLGRHVRARGHLDADASSIRCASGTAKRCCW